MSDEQQREAEYDEAPRGGRITVRSVGALALGLWVTLAVFWATSERSNVPLPMAEMRAVSEALLTGQTVEDILDIHGEDVSLFELYKPGWRASLLQTYVHLVSPRAWRRTDIGWENIDLLGQAMGVVAIALYTLVGVCLLGALRIRWRWPVRLAVGYALGVGLVGWLFEQFAIFFLLNRWTALLALGVPLGVLSALWAKRRQKEAPPDIGEPPVGKEFAVDFRDFILRVSAWTLLVIILGMSFFHAVCQPPEYWDGLILYLGYARKTHEMGGFPIKVVGQVGIGLGANYPHLFEVTQAGITRLVGHWTPLVGQWAAAWAALATTVLVHGLGLRVFRRGDAAILAALAFCSTPYMISFLQWASNYPLAMLFTASVLLAAYDWLATGHRKFALAMVLLAAFAAHVNYLMPCLWGVALLALALRWGWERANPVEDEPHMKHRKREPRVWRPVLVMVMVGLGLASTWYVRNIIVTGNPVYAFYHEALGGKNIDAEVMRSADVEWRLNGDGLQMRSLWDNLGRLPRFLALERASSWKFTPLATAFLVPGLLMLFAGMVRWRKTWHIEGSERLLWWFVGLSVFGGMALFHLAVSDIYLYQVLPLMVPAALIVTLPLLLAGTLGQWIRLLFLFSVVTISVPFALGGFKLTDPGDMLRLYALRHPFPAESIFYNRAFPGDVPIWNRLRRDHEGARLLTHDNRHLIYDEFVEIVHMDDLEVQPIYAVEGNRARLDFWRDLGVDLYLRIPNEFNHEANSWAGLQGLIDAGHLTRIHVAGEGDNELYAFPWTE